MNIRQAAVLIVTTVTLTVGVSSYFKQAKQADLDLSALDKKIEDKAQDILVKMDERRGARDAQISKIEQKIDQNHLLYMDQFKRLDSYLTEFIRQQNARAKEIDNGWGS